MLTAIMLNLALIGRALVSLAVVVLLPVLVCFAFVPFFRWITLGVLAYVGDSFAAVTSRDALDSMVAQINSDMDWALERSPKLIVVAHSQGAMLVRTALARKTRGDGVVLIGLGSGLGPLHSLRRAHDERLGMRGWTVLALGTAMVLLIAWSTYLTGVWLFIFGKAALRLVVDFVHWAWQCNAMPSCPYARVMRQGTTGLLRALTSAPMWIVSVSTLIVAGLTAAGLHRTGFYRLMQEWDRDLRLPKDAVHHWVEYSSPFDPVSCGPILSGCTDEPVHEVVNNWLLPQEHTTYRRNRAILLCVVQETATFSQPKIDVAAPWTRNHLEAAVDREMLRNRRVLRTQVVVEWIVVGIAVAYLVRLGVG